MTVVAISTVKKKAATKAVIGSKAPVAAKAVAKKEAAKRGDKPLPDLNAHILRAFEMAGGDAYLAEVARSHPSAFMSLLVKVLPLQLADEEGGGLRIGKVERVIVHPKA